MLRFPKKTALAVALSAALVLGAGTVAAAAVFQLPMFGFGPQASGSTTAAPQVIEKTVYEDHYVPKQQPTGASVQRTSNAGGTSQSRPSSAGGQSATAPAGGAAPADPSQGAAAPAPAEALASPSPSPSSAEEPREDREERDGDDESPPAADDERSTSSTSSTTSTTGDCREGESDSRLQSPQCGNASDDR